MTTATQPFAGTYTADPVHSSFGFAVRYQGVSLFKGTLDEVEAKLAGGRLEGAAKVESISIRTPEQFRAHVLSAEFFDAANHPEVAFASSQIDRTEFDMNWNAPLPSGGKALANEVTLTVELSLVEQQG